MLSEKIRKNFVLDVWFRFKPSRFVFVSYLHAPTHKNYHPVACFVVVLENYLDCSFDLFAPM
jgi:hypothetical protein